MWLLLPAISWILFEHQHATPLRVEACKRACAHLHVHKHASKYICTPHTSSDHHGQISANKSRTQTNVRMYGLQQKYPFNKRTHSQSLNSCENVLLSESLSAGGSMYRRDFSTCSMIYSASKDMHVTLYYSCCTMPWYVVAVSNNDLTCYILSIMCIASCCIVLC
jgi:hypothetical protein